MHYYSQSIRTALAPFIMSRLIALSGISFVFILVAHKAPEDLGLFSYVLALLTVISTVFPLLLATAGNNAASLMDKPAELNSFFSGGFTLSLAVGALTAAACFLAVQVATNFSGTQHWDEESFWSISLVYILATPLIATNNFLQMFFESTGKANRVAETRLKITLFCSAVLMLSCVISNREDFKLCAMLYFPLSEAMTLLLLTKPLSKKRYYSPRDAKKILSLSLRGGLPIAAGMTGQKVYFYLLMERLARVGSGLTAELSVFMTVAGILLIPSLALAQIHSFQVSQHRSQSKDLYRSGLVWNAGIFLLTAFVISLLGKYAFYIVGGELMHYRSQLLATVILFIFSTSLLSLAVAHLRANGETLMPQLLINVIMLGLLMPLLYCLEPHQSSLEIFLMLQSGAAALSFSLLGLRIAHIHKTNR